MLFRSTQLAGLWMSRHGYSAKTGKEKNDENEIVDDWIAAALREEGSMDE